MNWNDASTACAETREAIADAVIARSPLGAEAERHLAICADCRAYRADSESMWARLAELPTPSPSRDARARFDASLPRTPFAQTRRIGLLAAMLVFGIALGFGGARLNRGAPVAAVAADSVPRFLLLLYDNGPASSQVSPERMTAIIAEYSAWARRLAAAGQLVSAEKLRDTTQWLGGSVTTGDGATVGGFFLIRARDLAEARRIAEGCPHLKYGGRIELRPIHPT